MILFFAKPTYGAIDPVFDKTHRSAIMFAANNGIKWAGDISPDRMGFAAARNRVVEEALAAEKTLKADGVFWVDSDIKLPMEAITRLVSHDLDFVSGLYFQRVAPYWPLFARYTPEGSFEWARAYPENTIAPCDGIGFGCVYTSMKLLRAVSALPECKTDGPFGGVFGKHTYGEDFLFCLRARMAGFTPHIDTSIKCEHYLEPELSNEALYKLFQSKAGLPMGVA